MRQQKLSGYAEIVLCGPPFSAYEGSSGDGDVNIYRACVGNAAGDATKITNYNNGGATTDQMSNPVLSPDGLKIAFEQWNASSGFAEIWVVSRTPGSTASAVVVDGSHHCRTPQWASDSDTILYTRGGTGEGGAIETISVSSGSPTVLKTPVAGFSFWRPSFNFDDSRIAYWNSKDVGNDTAEGPWIMDADGSNAAQAHASLNYLVDGSQHAWARASDVLAYTDGTSVWKINGDGTSETQINSNGAIAGLPVRLSFAAWAAADAFIVATGSNGSQWRLHRIETDGSTSSLLNTTHGAMNQGSLKQAFVFSSRVWFIETGSSNNGGKIGSTAMDGSDYRVDLDVNLSTILDWLGGGAGFEWH